MLLSIFIYPQRFSLLIISKLRRVHLLTSSLDSGLIAMLIFTTNFENKVHHEKNITKSLSEYNSIIALTVVTAFYRQVLVYDTLAQQNIVQAGALTVDYGIHCVLKGIEYPAHAEYARFVRINPEAIRNPMLQSKARLARRLSLTIVIIMPVWTVYSMFLVWKLHREMAWKTFRKMDADLVMQHRYRTFQVSVC